MSNEKDIIVGLDIGTTKIACFIGQRADNGKVQILGFGKAPSNSVERGVVVGILDTSIAIKKAVEMASEQAGYDVKEVYVGIAGQHIRSKLSQGEIMIPREHRFIEQEDLDQLIDEQNNIALNPGEEIIHIFPQKYFVDGVELGEEINPIGVQAHQLKAVFHIVTGNTANIISIHKSVELAGLTIKGVVLEPVASALAVLDETDKSAGVALVDIGGGTTDIAIFHEGIIRHTSVLALAGNAITKDIKDGCQILRKHAETLKTRFGHCLPENVSENDIISIPGIRSQPPREIGMKTLAGIINARMVTILEQVKYEIEQSRLERQLVAGIVLTGGGAQLSDIKQLTEYVTCINTRIGMPDEHLVKDSDPEIINTMYSTGIGLVIYGLEKMEEMRLHTDKDEEVADEPVDTAPQDEPKVFADPFGSFEQEAPSSKETAVDDTPHVAEKASEGKKSGGDRRKKFNLTKVIEDWFAKTFTDDTIRNEGDEEDE